MAKEALRTLKNQHHKCYLTIKPIDWDKDINTTVKRKATSRKDKVPTFEETMHLLSMNETLEKFICWQKDIRDKLVTNKPKWEHIWDSFVKITDKVA